MDKKSYYFKHILALVVFYLSVVTRPTIVGFLTIFVVFFISLWNLQKERDAYCSIDDDIWKKTKLGISVHLVANSFILIVLLTAVLLLNYFNGLSLSEFAGSFSDSFSRYNFEMYYMKAAGILLAYLPIGISFNAFKISRMQKLKVPIEQPHTERIEDDFAEFYKDIEREEQKRLKY